MEIKITTHHTLLMLQVLAWIIFIGLCIEAGAVIVNSIITLFINPAGVSNFWQGKEYLASLLDLDSGHFLAMVLLMCIVMILKSTMFYLIVKLFSEKTLNLQKPFSLAIRRFILNLAYLSLGIGFFSHAGFKYAEWLSSQNALASADLSALHIAGSDVWLFLALILLVIAQLVKKGVEIQTENELTI
ncbi:DUF2975 domain-containing protein [Algoriphagus halophytocola]|uniref:DUF2975 domain-containing protein n=1 Tax=Algoriphagus halophytocola TaxID=2991499 RepID=UPI0022DD19EE|nr:DUF2975 domain-containing protein [Algoriphagus sp. TR-M9]WBL41982.1 DUF2975 domain-containing protein [Algoriphagus sp. TR-M9]